MAENTKVLSSNIPVAGSGPRRYRSRSSSSITRNSKKIPLIIPKATEYVFSPVNDTQQCANSISKCPSTNTSNCPSPVGLGCNNLGFISDSCPDMLTFAMEDAVRKVIKGSMNDLQEDVGKIQLTLSRMAKKMAERKRIAVIGAGPNGLTAAKCCLEEDLDVVVFDKTDNVGGLWRYREEDNDGLPSVMKSTVINTSKEISAYSDFPPPKHFPNFMHNTWMLRYFETYAEKFGVLQHVRLNKEVINVKTTEDYERTGNWYVSVRDVITNEVSTEVFEGVLVVTGHHCFPYMPELKGMDRFQGKVMHTHSLKKANGFEDKVVLVIGIGNSAVDAAVELCSVTKQVYLSTRRGAWLFRRVGPDGKPYDAAYLRRNLNCLSELAPFRLRCWFMERELNKTFNHKRYGIKPDHRILSQHPTINDALPNKILSGVVILKEDITEFTEHGVIFQSDEQEIPIDAVVLATGYQMKFPFLDEDIVCPKNNKITLYKYIFPPYLTHPSLALIGLAQPVGAIFPIAEAQSRWYALIMSGQKKLPSRESMLADIKSKAKEIAKRYVDSPRHTVQIDYIPYLDEMAKQIGCEPKLLRLLFTDPKLFWRLFTGPSLSYQYRLRGPHPWAGAREAILTYKERVQAALNTRKK